MQSKVDLSKIRANAGAYTEISKGDNEPIKVPTQVSTKKQPTKVKNKEISQKQPSVDETNLQQIYEQGTKCPTDNAFSIALPKGEKRPIRAGIVTLLSDSPNLYELIFYCDSYPQTIYSKQGFSHVKVEKDAKGGGIRVVFYRTSQRAK